MKIAILSDIHGNLDALSEVIENIKKQKIDKIFICGDLAVAGPQPVETIDYVINLSKEFDVTVIQGNTDEMVVKSTGSPDDKYTPPNKIMAEAVKFSQSVLRDDQIEYLNKLPVNYKESVGNLNILLVHGSPRRNNEDILPDLPLEKIKEMIESTNEDIIFCGHTHLPAVYKINNQTVVNAGSVGRPFSESPKACYAVLTYEDETVKRFNIQHVNVSYNHEQAAEKLAKQGFEGSDKLAKMLLKATSRYPE
jgi:putative phosphoesterase